MSNEKIANINVKLKSFFKRYVEFTYPFHKLADRQQSVLALLLYYHFQLKKEITNNKILWKEVFDYDTKVKIYTELDIKSSNLENVLTALRNNNVIIDGEISPFYIPTLDQKSNKFSITFNFNIIHE